MSRQVSSEPPGRIPGSGSGGTGAGNTASPDGAPSEGRCRVVSARVRELSPGAGVLVATAGEVMGGVSRPWPISRPWGPTSGVARSGAPMVGGGGPPKATGVGTCPSRGQ